MSGQQIGTAVGFVVGAYFGYPQLGAAIGGYIGGAIDPTEIKGPHIGDGQNQSSQEGVPIPWVLGTYGWIQGNIVQKSARREVKKKDDGKGSGTVAVTYEAHQDYCIMVCESSETRNSTVVGPLIVRVNGKIVYDMRPDKNFAAENAKFLQHHTFYVGNEDQLPDPTMEAITGVGNTPAYKGVFTCVCRDINLAQFGDAIPTYEWVMVSEGELVETNDTKVLPPSYSRFANVGNPLLDQEIYYDLVMYRTSPSGGGIGPVYIDTIQQAIDAADDCGFAPTPLPPSRFADFMPISEPGTPVLSRFQEGFDITADVKTWLIYQDRQWAGTVDSDLSGGATLGYLLPFDGQYYPGRDGYLFIVSDQESLPFHIAVGGTFPFPNRVYAIAPMVVRVERRKYFKVPATLPDAPGFFIDDDGQVKPLPTYTEQFGTFLALKREVIVPTDNALTDRWQSYELGPVMEVTDPNNTEAFWTAAAASAGVTGTYGVDYPQSSDRELIGTTTSTSVTGNPISVGQAITRIAVRGGLQAEQIDVDDVDQYLLGYGIANTYDGADCERSLLTAYGLYAAEYDGRLHFHKLGEDVEIVIDPGEMISGETQTDQTEREQAIEFPKSILLNYIDPTQDYAVRPQPWRRLTPDVRAIGEETMQVAVVMLPDSAAQTVETYGKRAWARAQGSEKFSMPFAGREEIYLRLHPGKAFALDGKRWVIDQLNIEDGEMAIEATYDRQSAYTSNVTAIPALPPTPPPSSLRGATVFAVLNVPALRDRDDKVLLYCAVAGLLPGWQGCVLQWSFDDGASWQIAIASMTQQSVIGYLTAPLPAASPYGDDVTNTLSVNVRGGELDSISDLQYLNELNACAIVNVDGTAEILQFQNADELQPNEYDLTMLGRGRLGTSAIAHAQGARFCMLESVYPLEVPSAYIGRQILLRPVTLGTVAENNASYALNFTTAASQTELMPAYLHAERIDDSLALSVVPRYRFGSDINPIASANFTGFRWMISDGTNSSTLDTDSSTLSTSFDVSGWASTIDVAVAQLNRITGPGPALEETV